MKAKLHFVCNGNVFRSRLAEAYAKSFELKDLKITSSGVKAKKYDENYVSSSARVLAKQNKITEYLSDRRTVTTTQILKNSDLIVFLNEDVYETARASFKFDEMKCLVWNIKDLEDYKGITRVQKRKRIMKHIRARVKDLMKEIKTGFWIDIVNERGDLLGVKLPVRIANEKGLWHHGCHVVITTPSGKMLVEKRAKKMIFAPGRLDISMGGYVDAGEMPMEAAVRELKEELGLVVSPKDLKLIEVGKASTYRPSYKTTSRVIGHVYHLKLKEENPKLDIQKKEVDEVFFLTKRQIQQLVKRRSLKPFGRLSYAQNYYERITKQVFDRIGK